MGILEGMAGVDCNSIELRLDQVVDCLEDYLVISAGIRVEGERERNARDAIRELQKVIPVRGNVLFIQQRTKRRREWYLGVGHAKNAELEAG